MELSYDGHFTLDDGTLVPGPGACHPALRSVADIVRKRHHEGPEVRVALMPEVSWQAETDITDLQYETLTLRRHQVVVSDRAGERWVWWVWLDEYGRGVATETAWEL